jgi:hypothetical protein
MRLALVVGVSKKDAVLFAQAVRKYRGKSLKYEVIAREVRSGSLSPSHTPEIYRFFALLRIAENSKTDVQQVETPLCQYRVRHSKPTI